MARLVGEEWFRAAAAVFVRGRLPRHPTLLHYGEGFADFLASFAPAAELPYLPGVARLDRFWTRGACGAPTRRRSTAALLPRLAPEALDTVTLLAASRGALGVVRRRADLHDLARNREKDGRSTSELDWRGEGALAHAAAGPGALERARRRGVARFSMPAPRGRPRRRGRRGARS